MATLHITVIARKFEFFKNSQDSKMSASSEITELCEIISEISKTFWYLRPQVRSKAKHSYGPCLTWYAKTLCKFVLHKLLHRVKSTINFNHLGQFLTFTNKCIHVDFLIHWVSQAS